TSDVVMALAFSPDGKTLLCATALAANKPGKLKFWDTATGKENAAFEVPAGFVLAAAFSSNGKTLAISADFGVGQQVQLWDVCTGKKPGELRVDNNGTDTFLKFSPDDETLAIWSANAAVRLLDVATGKERVFSQGRTDMVRCAAFSPDGKMLATGSPN